MLAHRNVTTAIRAGAVVCVSRCLRSACRCGSRREVGSRRPRPLEGPAPVFRPTKPPAPPPDRPAAPRAPAMVKEKPNSTRMYDEDGFRRRAACICVRSDLETEVRMPPGVGSKPPLVSRGCNRCGC